MADILSSLGTAAASASKLFELAVKIQNIEAQELIANLKSALADAKMQAADLKHEVLELREKLEAMDKKIAERAKTRAFIKDKLIYVNDPQPDETAGPYCPVCYSRDRKLSVLVENPFGMRTHGRWHCPACRQDFGGALG